MTPRARAADAAFLQLSAALARSASAERAGDLAAKRAADLASEEAKQTLELRITAPGHIGKVVVYQLKQVGRASCRERV